MNIKNKRRLHTLLRTICNKYSYSFNLVAKFIILAWIIVISLLLIPSLTRNVYAKDSVALYYTEQCGSCTTVLDEIAKYSIDDKIDLEMHQINGQQSVDDFYAAGSACGLKYSEMSVPMLKNGNNCSVNTEEILEKLYSLADVEITTNDGNQQDKESDDEGKIEDENDSKDNNVTTEQKTDSKSNQTTSDNVTDKSKPIFPPKSLSTLDIFFIIIAPTSLISIAYLMITRLRL